MKIFTLFHPPPRTFARGASQIRPICPIRLIAPVRYPLPIVHCPLTTPSLNPQPKNSHRAYMREINDLHRIMWEKAGKGGLKVGKAGPFSHLPPTFSQVSPPPNPPSPGCARFRPD